MSAYGEHLIKDGTELRDWLQASTLGTQKTITPQALRTLLDDARAYLASLSAEATDDTRVAWTQWENKAIRALNAMTQKANATFGHTNQLKSFELLGRTP